MPKLNLSLQEVVYEPGIISVLVNCGPKHPGKLENIQTGHQIFDFARKILEGKLMESQWIDTLGNPNDCDLDLRTMIGRNKDKAADYVFCLACLQLPQGSIDESDSCFRPLAPDEQAADTNKFQDTESTEIFLDSISDDIDTKGKYTIEDLLGES